MNGELQNKEHEAGASALGFYYQSFYALETLVAHSADGAAVAVERLDDVEVMADGRTLLYQLKHSLSVVPPPITMKARALWRTVKVWADILPTLTIADTTLHLVAVGKIPDESPLRALINFDADRTELVNAMVEEAQRVVDARRDAKARNGALPYTDKVQGCEAFLSLSETERNNLLRRVIIEPDSPPIDQIEMNIAKTLTLIPEDQRALVAQRLIEWWDRQIIYSLCGKRERAISRVELQAQIMSVISDLEQGRLVPEFETVVPPNDYQPDGLLARQIHLVNGRQSDLSRAIREEWRAREQRSHWLNANPAMATTIENYDLVLKEHWSDRHTLMSEECEELNSQERCEKGLELLRWTHDKAPMEVRPLGEGWTAAFYVRGSYQVLAVNLTVGWHPDFAKLLNEDQ